MIITLNLIYFLNIAVTTHFAQIINRNIIIIVAHVLNWVATICLTRYFPLILCN